jgi:hypothetical protein
MLPEHAEGKLSLASSAGVSVLCESLHEYPVDYELLSHHY